VAARYREDAEGEETAREAVVGGGHSGDGGVDAMEL